MVATEPPTRVPASARALMVRVAEVIGGPPATVMCPTYFAPEKFATPAAELFCHASMIQAAATGAEGISRAERGIAIVPAARVAVPMISSKRELETPA